MSRNTLFFAALSALGFACAAAQGQTPYGTERPSPPVAGNGPAAAPAVTEVQGSGLSDWILYRRPCCEGPLGDSVPIQTEFFLRSGPSFPFGGDFFGRALDTGWMIQGGARALFFNRPMTRAWAIDFSISNNNNHSSDPTATTINTGEIVTIRELNRTFVNVGFGREFYLWAPANQDGPMVRVGADFGGRWGTCNLETFQLRHQTDVIGGIYVAAHSDLEIPCGCCIFQTGIRAEYAYTFSDILKPVADVQDFNLLFSIGVRY
jgi:hypothetical protein